MFQDESELMLDTNVNLKVNSFHFRKLLHFATEDAGFMFSNSLYQQLNKMSMDSPLGPSVANVFLAHHETVWLKAFPLHFKPFLNMRYVDDCFVLFKERTHADQFLEYLKSKYPNKGGSRQKVAFSRYICGKKG